MNQDKRYKERVALAKRWLTEANWTPTDEEFDYSELEKRAQADFGYTHKNRARGLVAKAARLLRGEHVESLRGGAPRQYAHFSALLGSKCVLQIRSLYSSICIEADVTILIGDGNGLEWKFKMKNPAGEFVDVVGKLRSRESDG